MSDHHSLITRRTTYVMRGGKIVDKATAPPLNISTDPRIYVIGDVMEPMRHQATGRMYDSKARFRADTRAAGCVEVGNDPAIRRDPGVKGRMTGGWGDQASAAADVKRAIQELRSR